MAWKCRFAMVEISNHFYEAAEVKGKEYVYKYFPKVYLAAMHEVTALAFIVTMIMSPLFPALSEDAKSNYGAKVVIASFSLIIFSFNVGLAWRYWWLSKTRSGILAEAPTCASSFNKFTIIMLAVSSNFAVCIWLLPNQRAQELPAEIPLWTVRSIGALILCVYAVILYGAHLGNLLEDSSRSEAVKKGDKVFIGIYGFFVILLVCAYIYHALMSRRQEDETYSELYLEVVLAFWSVCLLLVYSFTTPEKPLVTITQIGTAEQGNLTSRNRKCPSCLEWFSCVALLNTPLEERTIWPRLYLGAFHETFGITLIITWGLTLAIPILRPQISDHPAKVIIGSYNPCFGWDYFPASWIAVCCCSFNVYFAYRYAWLANLRRSLLRGEGETTWGSTVSILAAYALALSSNLWLILWLLGPNPEDPIGDLDGPETFWWSVHTGIFAFMCAAEYFTYLGLLLDIGMSPRSESVTTNQKVFVVVYGYCCAYLIFVYGYNLAFHDKGSGVPALGSDWVTQISDVMWMACIFAISKFLPEEPPLKQETWVPQDELEEAPE